MLYSFTVTCYIASMSFLWTQCRLFSFIFHTIAIHNNVNYSKIYCVNKSTFKFLLKTQSVIQHYIIVNEKIKQRLYQLSLTKNMSSTPLKKLNSVFFKNKLKFKHQPSFLIKQKISLLLSFINFEFCVSLHFVKNDVL